ncbi:hypothetical protein AB0A70_16870 [Streptomyces morookaense]|uniref:hypothetical protein n=1 Tax=Streptomyces morookaense TaxID=1970 RepID=UPI0033CFA47F
MLVQAGWSHAQLAAAVRAVAAENGQTLACDRSSVARWIHGARPRPPVPQYLLEVLERRLGRPVTAQEAGLSRAPATALDVSWDTDPLRNLTHLAHSELAPYRGGLHAAGAYRLAVLTMPGWDQLMTRPRPAHRPPAPDAGRRVGRTEVEAIQAVIAFFARTTALYGGGHARVALVCHLAHDVAPWLRAPATENVHRRLLAAGAQLAILLGDMCADDSRDALAQYYHRTAAHLAADAHDPATYAIALHAMSTHAHELGHPPAARALAQQAADAARHHAHPAIQTYAHAQLAVTEARTHHRPAALAALHTAEHLHTHTEPPTPTPFRRLPPLPTCPHPGRPRRPRRHPQRPHHLPAHPSRRPPPRPHPHHRPPRRSPAPPRTPRSRPGQLGTLPRRLPRPPLSPRHPPPDRHAPTP